ncbi:MAG TPA: efflux RND transporter periplasmic adaptor subunit [Thermoanaerobaculia bacterium]
MKKKTIFLVSAIGLVAGLTSAYVFGIKSQAQPPAFKPATNPYAQGIYANGIIESDQPGGENINIYAEVAGPITQVLVGEGDRVAAGAPLVRIDDSVPRATAEQLRLQAEAAQTQLQELRSQPRKETLEVASAQVDAARANLKMAEDTYAKQRRAYDIDPESVSKDAVDTAENATKVARAALDVAQRQYDLTRAGAWIYDVQAQETQCHALTQAYQASSALLAKYTIRAPVDGVVLSLNAALGSYVSTQGVYDTYTQASAPVIVMSRAQAYLGVRCYVDEILVGRLPPPGRIRAEMTIRGTDTKIPLDFVRVQPYVSPKIALSDQRQERVDLRVLPVIFRFARRAGVATYPGQLVDVYVGQ